MSRQSEFLLPLAVIRFFLFDTACKDKFLKLIYSYQKNMYEKLYRIKQKLFKKKHLLKIEIIFPRTQANEITTH